MREDHPTVGMKKEGREGREDEMCDGGSVTYGECFEFRSGVPKVRSSRQRRSRGAENPSGVDD